MRRRDFLRAAVAFAAAAAVPKTLQVGGDVEVLPHGWCLQCQRVGCDNFWHNKINASWFNTDEVMRALSARLDLVPDTPWYAPLLDS